MLTYLASPIDTCGFNPEFNQGRSQLIRNLSEAGATVFAPHEAWTLDLGQSDLKAKSRLAAVNFYALDQADLVVALVPPGVPTVGTPIEVYHALVVNRVKVALWFGAAHNHGIGAMWSYLLTNYGTQIYWMPTDPDADDIRQIVEWARPRQEAVV